MPVRRSKKITTAKNLPKPLSIWQTLGPSFILLGLALGSGELILWPYLSANYGLGLLWGAAMGISFQYLLNTELMRYTLAWGETVFVGWRKISILLPIWFIVSTFIPWSLPGFSSASSEIIHAYLPMISPTVITIGLLLFTGLVLTGGPSLYKTMEKFEKGIVFMSIPLILLLAVLFIRPPDLAEAMTGLVGAGDGWWFFPPGIALASFLGAFAYAGGGGNLNLAHSAYIKEKGFGMGKYAAKIGSIFSDNFQAVKLEGQTFAESTLNRKRWKQWWRLVTLEHGIVFWFTGFVGIVLLSTLSKVLVFGQAAEEGLSFLFLQSEAITAAGLPLLGGVFLVAVAVMLFSTQVIVLEASSRIISENVTLLFYKPGLKFNTSLAFYIALWLQIGLGIFLLLSGLQEPRFILTLAAVLNGAAMMVSFPLIWWLNRMHLRPAYRPGVFRQAGLLVAFGFFVFFVGITLANFSI